MSTAETIYELVKTLPEEQANLVLMFIQFVHQQVSQLQGQTPLVATADLSAWSTLVHDLSGAWADFPEPDALRMGTK